MSAEVVRNLNVSVQNVGHAGELSDYTPPKLASKIEMFRGGGMNVATPLVLGQEDMEASLTFVSFSKALRVRFGLLEGDKTTIIVYKEVRDTDGVIYAHQDTLTGIVKEQDSGTIKPGEKAELKLTLALDYYKEEIDGAVVQEIDAENMIHIVDGVDRLAPSRAALKL